MTPNPKAQKALMLLLAALVLFATTRARLSQYQPVTAPSSTFVKTTKLTECRPKLMVLPDLHIPEPFVIDPSQCDDPMMPAAAILHASEPRPLLPPLRL